MVSTEKKVITLFEGCDTIVRLAKFAGAFHDGLQDRLNIGRRGCNHLEDVGASGLVGQCFRKVAGLGLHFVEQPDVLDGDDGLVGKGGDQFDLLVGERLNCASVSGR